MSASSPRRAATSASLVLVIVTLLWGTTFPAMKALSAVMPPGLMVGVRWAMAALVLAPMVTWTNRRLWRDAFVLTVPLFLSFLLQVIALTMMSAGRNAFITGLNVILVPLLLPLMGGRTSLQSYAAAGVATFGIVVMSYEQGSSPLADALTFGCAIAFAFYILGMERLAGRHSALSLAGGQATMMALLSLLWIAGERIWWGEAYASMAARTTEVWPQLIYLGLLCSAFALILQVWAQARATAVQAAIIYALEPFFAACFAWWWLDERLGMRGLIGGLLVVAGMILSQLPAPTRATVQQPHAPN